MTPAWIHAVDPPDIWVRVSSKLPTGTETDYLLQVHGTTSIWSFHAKLMWIEDQESVHLRRMMEVQAPTIRELAPHELCYRFAMVGEPMRHISKQKARKAIGQMTATISGDGLNHEVLVYDVSKGGVGIIAPEPLTTGLKLRFSAEVRGHVITADCEVRHSQRSNQSPQLCRCGLQFVNMSRLDAAKWNWALEEAEQQGLSRPFVEKEPPADYVPSTFIVEQSDPVTLEDLGLPEFQPMPMPPGFEPEEDALVSEEPAPTDVLFGVLDRTCVVDQFGAWRVERLEAKRRRLDQIHDWDESLAIILETALDEETETKPTPADLQHVLTALRDLHAYEKALESDLLTGIQEFSAKSEPKAEVQEEKAA